MSATEELVPMLKKLRLSGVLQLLELRYQAGHRRQPRTLGGSLPAPGRRGGAARGEAAHAAHPARHFEHAKTIEDFDFTFNASVPKAKVLELMPRCESSRRA